MKNVIMIIFLLPVQTVLACKCSEPPIYSRYMVSDFIGVVEVTDSNEAADDQSFYLSSLKPVTTFKGTMPETIRIEKSEASSCGILIEPGEQWLVYLQKNGNDNYYLSYCSHPVQIQTSNNERISLSKEESFNLKQLTFLKKLLPGIHSKELISLNYYKFNDFLEQYNKRSFKSSSAYYLISFNRDLTIEGIKILRGFSQDIDSAIINYFKTEAEWHKGPFSPLWPYTTTLNQPVQYVFGIYYNKSNKSLLPFYLANSNIQSKIIE